jgi:hypothetical protein
LSGIVAAGGLCEAMLESSDAWLSPKLRVSDLARSEAPTDVGMTNWPGL